MRDMPKLIEVPKPFAGRVAVVTGASSGIGWSLARVLAQEGYKIGLIARRPEPLEALGQEIRTAGGTAATATADVGERAQTQAAFAKIRDALGPADLVVANAGVGMPTLLDPVNIDHVEQMIRINVMGVIYTIEAALPDMLRRGSGHLAAVSSLAAYKGLPGESAYCASKAAVSSYLEGLRIHLRERGIVVTTICPGFVKTPMTEINNFHMPFLLDADTAARRIVNALRRRRKVYNFPWQASLLMKLTRWLPDWIVARTMHSYNENPPMPQ
jgi:short-subunit dehydrogenase